MCRWRGQTRRHTFENLVDGSSQIVGIRPVRVVCLELAGIADVPDVITDAILVVVLDFHRVFGQFLADGNCFLHRAVALAATAGVVHLTWPGILMIVPEHVHQIVRMNVVANLLSFVAQDGVDLIRDGKLDLVRQEPMQHGPRMPRPR